MVRHEQPSEVCRDCGTEVTFGPGSQEPGPVLCIQCRHKKASKSNKDAWQQDSPAPRSGDIADF